MNNRAIAWVLCGLGVLSACELIADFDQDKLNDNRTIGVTPLPVLDGAIAVVPDGSLRADGALTRDDAGLPPDAAGDAGASDVPDAEVASDGAVDASDASALRDAGDADAAEADDAAITDAGLSLLADV